MVIIWYLRLFPTICSVPIRNEQSQIETAKTYNLQEKDLRKQSHKFNPEFLSAINCLLLLFHCEYLVMSQIYQHFFSLNIYNNSLSRRQSVCNPTWI